MSRYECVEDQKAAGFPVTAACAAVEVSKSGFYDWRVRVAAGPTPAEDDEARLVALMNAIFDASDGNYGVPRMVRELRAGGLVVNPKRVRRLMRKHGMTGRFRRRRVRTTFPGPDGYTIPDSPTFRPVKAGCSLPPWSISARDAVWAIRWLSTYVPSW